MIIWSSKNLPLTLSLWFIFLYRFGLVTCYSQIKLNELTLLIEVIHRERCICTNAIFVSITSWHIWNRCPYPTSNFCLGDLKRQTTFEVIGRWKLKSQDILFLLRRQFKLLRKFGSIVWNIAKCRSIKWASKLWEKSGSRRGISGENPY